jgi:hypothetical protein
MKDSPYRGKRLEMHEIYSLYQVLKFYYEDLIDLPPSAVADIMKAEFGCKVTEKDVYLYLLMAPHWDANGNLNSYD